MHPQTPVLLRQMPTLLRLDGYFGISLNVTITYIAFEIRKPNGSMSSASVSGECSTQGVLIILIHPLSLRNVASASLIAALIMLILGLFLVMIGGSTITKNQVPVFSHFAHIILYLSPTKNHVSKVK